MSIHLVTGATGLVGTELVAQLRAAGHEVRTLTTRSGQSPDPNTHYWSPETGWLDPVVLRGVSVVHHLAGASVSEKWTAEHRREILKSRQQGTDLLVDRLSAMLPLFRAGLGSPLGSGQQWMPWIHVADLAAAFVHASQLESMDGVYNAVGIAPATNRDFSAALARVLNKPFWAPAPPAFLLRLVLGDRSVLVLGSTPAASDKLRATGFVHRYTDLEAALASVVQGIM